MAIPTKTINENNAPSEGPMSSSLQAFHELAHKQKTPLNVQIQLTDLCNLRCEFCYNSLEHKKDELSTEEIFTLLAQLREAGTLYLTLTGGEPTLHPDFEKIAREVRRLGFALEIITNATLLTEKHFDLFDELKPRYVAVSLHGLQQASHERLTQSPESFKKTVRSIEIMKERDIPVQLRIPITRYNFEELDELSTYAEMMGISYRLDCNITYREDGDQSSIGMRVDDSQANAYYARLWKDWMAANPKVEVTGQSLAADLEVIEDNHLCAAGHTYCYIDSVGTVHPCPSYQRPAGNIREQSFNDIWYESDFLKSLRDMTHGKLKGCEGCGDKGFCTFCPGDARGEGVDKDFGFGQYDRGCQNAALNREAFEAVVLQPQPSA